MGEDLSEVFSPILNIILTNSLIDINLLLNIKATESRKMQNEEKDIVDLYIPRKCSATNRLIKAKDHSAVQIDVSEVSK